MKEYKCENCGLEKWDNTGIGIRVGVDFKKEDFMKKFCSCKSIISPSNKKG